MTDEIKEFIEDALYDLHGDYSYTEWDEWSGTSYNTKGVLLVFEKLIESGLLSPKKENINQNKN